MNGTRIKKLALPEFLRKLPRVDFVRQPAPTTEASRDPDVIFNVGSLDDLFGKAEERGKLQPEESRKEAVADTAASGFAEPKQSF